MGQACIMQCQTSSDQCRAQKSQEVQQCEWRNQVAQATYDKCVANNPDNAAMACTNTSTMCGMANTYECDVRYRQCYQACGGTVSEEQAK
jgi:hypothetical protein